MWVDVTAHSDGSVSVDGLQWRPFTTDTAAGHVLRDLAALHDGERPEGLQISDEEIERRWSTLMSFMDPSTMAQSPATPTGGEPVALSEEQIREAVAATPQGSGPSASASPTPDYPSSPRPSPGGQGSSSAAASTPAREEAHKPRSTNR